MNHTFRGDKGHDKGQWSGGGNTISLTWTAGADVGLTFSGTYTTTPVKEYNGVYIFDGIPVTGQLVKGAVAGC